MTGTYLRMDIQKASGGSLGLALSDNREPDLRGSREGDFR